MHVSISSRVAAGKRAVTGTSLGGQRQSMLTRREGLVYF